MLFGTLMGPPLQCGVFPVQIPVGRLQLHGCASVFVAFQEVLGRTPDGFHVAPLSSRVALFVKQLRPGVTLVEIARSCGNWLVQHAGQTACGVSVALSRTHVSGLPCDDSLLTLL